MEDIKILVKNPYNKFNCTTEDEAKKFIKILYDIGYAWWYNRDYTEENYWNDHKEETCYSIEHGNIVFGYKSGYPPDYNIINVKDLIEGNRTPFKLHR